MTENEKKQTVRVTNIQRFCLHDGPGVRTTVFLKGCSVHCPWCANPENISYAVQQWRDADTGETGRYGYDITLEALAHELRKDKCFYLDGGGVTFSGGEPLLQIHRYEPLLKALKEEKIHLAVETALFVDLECVERALPYFDWWYADMKVLHPAQCRKILGGRAEQYERNLCLAAEKAPKLCVRIPCCSGVTDEPENIQCLLTALQAAGIKEVELLEVHHLGDKKRRTLGLSDGGFAKDNGSAVQAIAQALHDTGITFSIMRT